MELQSISAKISFEAAEDLIARNALINQMNARAYNQFYCFTFEDDDYERKLFRLKSYNFIPDYFLMTVPDNDVENAARLLQDINNHIIIKYEKAGYNADDFMYNRLTVKLKVIGKANAS